MIEKNKRRRDYFNIKTIIKETEEARGIKNPTAKEVLEYMIGDSDGWCNGEYTLWKYEEVNKKNFIQRLNMLWVYPLFILTIPLQYLFTGSFGVNKNTRIGRVINWLVKLS